MDLVRNPGQYSIKLWPFCPTKARGGWGGDKELLLYAGPDCCNGLEQGDTGEDAVILALFQCTKSMVEVTSKSQMRI